MWQAGIVVKSTQDKELFLLLSYIGELGLKPGDRLPSIRNVAGALGLNPSQVRSSILKASALGLLETHPRAGTYVRQFDFSRILDLFTLLIAVGDVDSRFRLLHIHELKTILERGIFAAAAERATDEEIHELGMYVEESAQAPDVRSLVELDEQIHLVVARMSRNPFSVSLLSIINGMLRSDRLSNTAYFATRDATLRQHRQMYEAIRGRNIEEAVRLATIHGDRRKQLLMGDAPSPVALEGVASTAG